MMTPFLFQYNSSEIIAKLRSEEKTLLRNIVFELESGESMALIGKTGAGKTMLALSILGLLPENVYMKDAKITLDGIELFGLASKDRTRFLGNEIVYIPQNGSEFLNPELDVFSNLKDSMKKAGIKRSEFKELALEKLALVGFPHPEEIIHKYPFELSGGECQRVTIAIAACSNAKLLIADEPTNGLDDENIKIFLDLLKFAFPDAAKIIITHDPKIAKLCDKTLGITKQ